MGVRNSSLSYRGEAQPDLGSHHALPAFVAAGSVADLSTFTPPTTPQGGTGEDFSSTETREKTLRYSRCPCRISIFNIWSGLERQLELSFAAMDREECGLVAYRELEPLLRHILMQMGFLESLVPFFSSSGELLAEEVSTYLARYKLNLDNELDLEDWKTLAICWVQRLLDAKSEAIQDWKDAEAAMQEEQAHKYQMAMQTFQEQYIDTLHNYYGSVKAAHEQEERYREEWENSLALQDEFRRQQMEYVAGANAEALNLFQRNMGDSSRGWRLLAESLDLGRHYSTDAGANMVKFAYPVNTTSTGAPISGGAPLPRRRQRNRETGEGVRMTVGCI